MEHIHIKGAREHNRGSISASERSERVGVRD
ncbi:hypothetical protein GETHPA_15230 [Geothrix rubra]|uniref:Uncharacterized protein n=1 Tax=Geothrix rubra TaxID=2927977 RepID=A0ABQ5Q6E5_9BACT|nr:hypothetical protein GETHPA_15230 [Geothrix rubra]